MAKATTQLVYPESVISTGGEFRSPGDPNGGHRGVDHSQLRVIAGGLSTEFQPWAEGRVVGIRRRNAGIYGRYIEIQDAEGVFWSYCHMKSINDALELGDVVTFTTVLGVMGKTGSAPGLTGEHLHSMCAREIDAVNRGGIATFDPITHINDRLRFSLRGAAASAAIAPLLEEGDPEMFQYSKKSGTRWFVHPSLPVQRISPGEWAANVELGIRTERRVDNRKAEIFRRRQNARARDLDVKFASFSDADAAVEQVLDKFDLDDGELASQVSDEVYSRVDASADPLPEVMLEQIANDAVIAAGGHVPQ